MTSLADPYDGEDFYCDVALPNCAHLNIVHDGPGVLAYYHTRPFWDVHIVVVPKRHVASLIDPTGADESLIRELLSVVREVAAAIEHECGAARVLTNVGAYQDSKHLHIHVSSGDER